jgi:hypothetical protein
MNVGKLYQIKKYFWFLYPSKDIAAIVEAAVATDVPVVDTAAAYAARLSAHWSKHFNCKVSYIGPNSIFMLLEQDEKYCKILSTNGEVGWIILAPWCENDIEEVNQ